MKRAITAVLPAFVVLIAGIFVLHYQRAEITLLKSAGSQGMTLKADDRRDRSSSPEETVPSTVTPPRPSVPAGEARAAAFLQGLRDKAQPLIDKAERDAAGARARHKAGRVALLLGLNPADADALRVHLEKPEAPNVTVAAREWLTQHRGPDDTAKYDAAETASRAAAVEHDAQEAIYRLSRIVDLTPDQKDRLYAGFVRKAAEAPAIEAAPHDLRIAFTVQDTPSLTNPESLARPLLTPEQLAFYDAARAQESTAVANSAQEVMGQLMPALLESLQEAAAEGEE